jgi:hypothetical protein
MFINDFTTSYWLIILKGGLGGGVGVSKVVKSVDRFTQLKKTNASIYKKLDT